MAGLGKAIDENIEGENRIERIENIQERFSEEEIQQMADNGSDVAEDALIRMTQDFLGNREADEIINDEETWEENPTEALEALRETLIERDPDLNNYELENGPFPADHSDLLRDLLRNGNVEVAKEYSELVGQYTDHSTDSPRDLDRIYEEKIEEDPKAAIKIAENFDTEKDKKKAVRALVQKYKEEGARYSEALARKRHGRLLERPAEKLHEHFMDKGNYEDAAWVLQSAKEQGHMPSDYSEKDIHKAAEKEMEKRRDEGDYFGAVEVAEEYNIQNEEKIKDTLLLGVTTGEIGEGYFEKKVEEHGYDLKVPGQEEENSSEQEQSYDQEPQGQSQEETVGDSSGFLGKIRKYVN